MIERTHIKTFYRCVMLSGVGVASFGHALCSSGWALVLIGVGGVLSYAAGFGMGDVALLSDEDIEEIVK